MSLAPLTRPALPRFRVFDTFVHAVSRSEVWYLLARFLEDGRPHQIVTVNLDFLRIARAHPAFNDVINASDLSVADGRPLAWMAGYLGLRCDRITGPDLIEQLARLSTERGYKIYLLGGASGIPEQAAAALEKSYPGIQICGSYSPPLSDYPLPPEVDTEIVRRIEAARPDILLVGLGCPKQDLWISDHMDRLGVGVSIGVGGSFNFLSGHIGRAPSWLQRWGLEWVYRLYKEPRRLWRRYLLGDVPFALRLLFSEAARRLRLAGRSALSRET
jgi:N-acetylglucosaminyldiphosphoundecaprenol N-acetyl-beta-D-mannosaminyltransferase